jgi:hypothetical protein
MAAIPFEAKDEAEEAKYESESGAAYTEFLVCFMPMFLMITCLIQMALMNVAHLIVQHSAVLAARAAIVVLPDNPKCYSDNPANQLATGSTGGENFLEEFLGSLGSRTPIPDLGDFGRGLGGGDPTRDPNAPGSDPRQVYFQTNERYMAIHNAASVPLMALSPTPLVLRKRDSNIGRALGAGSVTAILARVGTSLVYNRAALAVTFINGGQYVNQYGPQDMVTARVTYAFNCGVPLARAVMCKDAIGVRYPGSEAVRREIGRAIGMPSPGNILGALGAIRNADRDGGAADAGSAELRTAPNAAGLLLGLLTGQRFAIIRGEASMPNQGSINNYAYRADYMCGHKPAEGNEGECR